VQGQVEGFYEHCNEPSSSMGEFLGEDLLAPEEGICFIKLSGANCVFVLCLATVSLTLEVG
jgi:hypothetical protein